MRSEHINQADNKLENANQLRIESIEAQKTGTNTLEARVNLINPAELKINKILINGIDTEIIRNTTQNGKTYIQLFLQLPKNYSYHLL